MRTSHISLVLFFASSLCLAQTSKLSDWSKLLLEKKDIKGAKALCTTYIGSKVIVEQVEADKCLANVALAGKGLLMLEGNDAGGGDIHGGFTEQSVDEAILHLDHGLKLAPQDLSIHQGRLHILEVSGRYDALIKAIDESCNTYRGKDALSAWQAYVGELNDLQQYGVALAFSQVLDKHYPNNPDVLGNIGAFLDLLKRDKEALPYLERAVALAPNDPINAWDLARAYDYSDQLDLAAKWYPKALALMTNAEQLKESSCLYAEFVEKKQHDATLACTLQKQSCPQEKRTACAK